MRPLGQGLILFHESPAAREAICTTRRVAGTWLAPIVLKWQHNRDNNEVVEFYVLHQDVGKFNQRFALKDAATIQPSIHGSLP